MHMSEDQLKSMGYAVHGNKAVRLSPSTISAQKAKSTVTPAPADARGTAESKPQRRLYELLTMTPSLKHLPWQWEYQNPVPGRTFSLDIGVELERAHGAPPFKGALECDGWAHHGRHLKGFKRDREKDRQLALCGWRVMRISAGEIMKSPGPLLDDIERWLDLEVPGWRDWKGESL